MTIPSLKWTLKTCTVEWCHHPSHFYFKIEIRGKLDMWKLPYTLEKEDVLSLLMPEPSSVLRVTVVKAKGLKYRDEGVLRFKHLTKQNRRKSCLNVLRWMTSLYCTMYRQSRTVAFSTFSDCSFLALSITSEQSLRLGSLFPSEQFRSPRAKVMTKLDLYIN